MKARTRLRSTAARTFASAAYLQLVRDQARFKRRLLRQPPTVHYFHQVDDPYSHLAVQKLDQLKAAYRLPFQAHLVSQPTAAYRGSSELFDAWAVRDALSVAAGYGVTLRVACLPEAAAVRTANDALAAHLDRDDFARAATEVGAALWAGSAPCGTLNQRSGEGAVRDGNALRLKWGHYAGAMFNFDGEWFWGIDRLRTLEQRLIAEGFANRADGPCVPEPTPVDTSGYAAHHIVLEYFPSLRSPYTAIGHQRVVDLAARSGVTLKLRLVMPMMMRGIPAPPAKQRYIIVDCAREARARNVPFGRIVDPYGEPVKRAFALFPGAMALGKGLQFVTAYLDAAWSRGIDITTEDGLRRVAADADIEWGTLRRAADGTDWQAILNNNLNAMLDCGLWGVPSFRVSGGNDATAFACWGQDRIWRVENEIARRA
jgi:2-hydroxychromene-2-carboxylate isomerase